MAAARPPTAPQAATAEARRSGGNTASTRASEAGNSAAAPSACSTRENTSSPAEGAMPQSSDATLNSVTPPRKKPRLP